MKSFVKDLLSLFSGVAKVKNIRGYNSQGYVDRPGVWWKS